MPLRIIRNIAFVSVLCWGVIVSNAANAADTFKLDMSHTSIVFAIKHLEFSYTYGRFNRATGVFTLDQANPAASKFELNIETATVDTNDPKRDEHLRGPDFFNANQFPTIKFVSKSVKPTETGMDVTGDLTLHGVTKEVTLSLRKLGEGMSMFKDYRVGLHCEHRINRSDYGMTGMIPSIGDNVAITISFEAVKQ